MKNNIEVFTQNSIRIRSGIGNIYIDPFRMKEEPKDADYILITHDHYDHFSPEDIRKAAGKGCVLVVPKKMQGKAREAEGFVSSIRTVEPGAAYEIEGLKVETVAAYNILKPFHPKSAAMNAKKAAELVNKIRPAAAIPTHYGGIVGKKEDADVFAAGVKAPVVVEIKMQY